MALGQEGHPPQGDSDHVIGTAHKGQRRQQTARLMASNGEEVLVNTYEFAADAGRPKKAPPPEEEDSLEQLTEDLQLNKPKRNTFFEGEEERLGYDLFHLGKLAMVEICISSVLDEKTWWAIPREGKPAWILPRAVWERMQQGFINGLNPDHDGPINKDLFAESEISSLFPSTEEMPLKLVE